MDRQIETIRDLLYEKILFYREIVETLMEERSYLAKADVDALWEVSAKKQELVTSVEELRAKILEVLADMSIGHGMGVSSFSLSKLVLQIPSDQRSLIKKSHLTLVGLKAQTKQLSAENKVFIEESLEFLDEIIGVIAGPGSGDEDVYDGGGAMQARSRSNRLFCREV